MRTTLQSYSTPEVTPFGSLAHLTKASFSNNQKDSIFFAGVPVGSAVGSLDACVSENPQKPSGQCEF